MVLGEAKNRKLRAICEAEMHRLELRQRNGVSGEIDRKKQKNTRMGSLRAIMES